MANSKKIVLFIVEGINDVTSLSICLEKILTDSSVHFEMTDGDLTTKTGINSTNIVGKIGDFIKER